MRFNKPISKKRDGTFELKLGETERQLLKSLPNEVKQLLDDKDESTIRLRPITYSADPELEAEVIRLVGDDLVEHHKFALDTLSDTASESLVTEDQMVAWLQAINQVRLVLGTKLDVTDDEDSLRVATATNPAMVASYRYLSWLQSCAIEELS